MLSNLKDIIDFILHIDVHLEELVEYAGIWSYIVLFLVIFSETAFVFTVFLPSDVVIFTACAFSTLHNSLSIPILMIMFCAGAFLGDNVNFKFGRRFRNRVKRKEKILFINNKNIEKAEKFYDKSGTTTVIISRFVPVLRALAPFVAGVSDREQKWFAKRNIITCILWTCFFTSLGYFFGNLDFVREKFGIIVIGIASVTILMAVISTLISRIVLGHKK